MANRLFFDDQTLNLEQKTICGSFEPNGTGAPLNVSGLGFTVARTGVGTFVVTLADEYMQLLAAFADLALATPGVDIAQVGLVNVEGTGTGALTATITVLSGATGSAADIGPTAGSVVSFALEVQNTKAPPTTSAT